MNILESREDYLEEILILKNKQGIVRQIDIVNEMKFSKPSVSVAMKKLEENGYITINNGNIELTKNGLKIANKIYERHLIISKFLISLGVDPKTAKDDACKIEHDLSNKTFLAIKNIVNKK